MDAIVHRMRLLSRSRIVIASNSALSCHGRTTHHMKQELLADLCGKGSELDISSVLDESGVTIFPLLWHI